MKNNKNKIVNMKKFFKNKKCTFRDIIPKYYKIYAVILSSLIATVIAFTFRYLILSYFNLDILIVTETPFLSLITLFNVNFIRFSFKYYLENLFNKPSFMDINDILNTPSPPANPPVQNPQPPVQNPQPPVNPVGNVQGNPQGGNVQGNILGHLFTYQNGSYTIRDPQNIGARGYINPQTGLPYPSSQPYAKNLSEAMKDAANRHGNPTVGWNPHAFDANSRRFFEDFMRFNYPNRAEDSWWNSSPIRKNIRRLP
jgi:hypothetical protein